MGVWDPLKKAVDKVGDEGEHLWNAGKKKVGEGVDWATDKVGAGFDGVGLHGLADSVEDWGDRTGSSLGAKIAEQQLGQTEEANELIHGNAKEIRASAGHLKDFHAAFDRVGKGMRGLDASHWRGQAAETFRAKFEMHPAQWTHAADACEKAYQALDAYADTVTWAQGQAKEAVAAYKEGKALTKKALDAHQAQAEAYKEAATAYNAKLDQGKDPGTRPVPPGDFTDPGAAKIKEAKEILAHARSQRDSAAGKAAATVKGALEHAPKKPAFHNRMSADFADFRTASTIEGNHFAGGFVKAGAGVVKFVRGVNPIDPYNLTHPALYLDHLNTTVAGAVALNNHPERLPSVLLGDGWGKDPSEAAGRLSFDLASALGTGGTSTAGTVGRRAVAHGARDLAERSAGRTGAEAAESGAARARGSKEPKDGGQPNEQKCTGGTDPINLATGRMFLPQTDVSLPGALPLVFRRQAESGYRAGRWFGPSWASTADERLEIDAEGVVFVRSDGMLLSYPHPAPDVPTLPSEGPRWPLTVDASGSYVIKDPLAELTWHFTPYDDELALLDQVTDRGGNWVRWEYDA
ncbi:putative T7SS-secreted protein, partial [Streptomyces sp. ISL-11]|uniref:putative T7SS-secreted protein n=1 Tax=Streptomyces sp. ISL-11 TaxID=2819174 RepID=UPI001C18F59A